MTRPFGIGGAAGRGFGGAARQQLRGPVICTSTAGLLRLVRKRDRHAVLHREVGPVFRHAKHDRVAVAEQVRSSSARSSFTEKRLCSRRPGPLTVSLETVRLSCAGSSFTA